MSTAPGSPTLRETHTCSQILNEAPWVVGIVFSFEATQQTSQPFISVALGLLMWKDVSLSLYLANRRPAGKMQFPTSLRIHILGGIWREI